MKLFTIGHSNHSIESFLTLLREHNVTALVDVRSHPYSRFLNHFNKVSLQKSLIQERIQYVHLGQELGARPDDPNCYVEGRALYEKIAATEKFKEGIQRIFKGLEKKYNIALMCVEKDPLTCHRAILIAQHLFSCGIDINHILNDGELESHGHLEDRLLIKKGFSQFANHSDNNLQLSLFNSLNTSLANREDCLKEAYRLQGNEIAYVENLDNNHDHKNSSLHNWLQ